MKKYQKVSIIVCHHKGELVKKALETLLMTKEVKFEIILATSASDRVSEFQKEFPAVKVVDIQGGPAKKRNIATRFSDGDCFAFFDDDVEVNPYTIFFMLRELETDGVGMVYGKLLNMEDHSRLDEAGSFLTWSGFLYARCESGIVDRGQFEKIVPVLAGKSASCIVDRALFWKVGGFDISYEILGEETDLSWRIWLLGYKVLYCPRSVCYHAFNTRFKPVDFYIPRRVYFNGCRNYLSMLITNLSIKNLAIPLLTQTLVWGMAVVAFFVTGKFEASVNVLKGLCYVIVNYKSIIQKRKIVQNMRVISDRVLLPQITHNPPLSYYVLRFIHYIKTGRHG